MNIKRVLALICIIFLVFVIPIRVSANDENNEKHIILIDAGHGGIDGGARSKNGTIEKDINLAIATKLKNKLEDSGYAVYMTREDDSELDKKKVNDLNARCKMKKDKKCDVFISIHQNMFPSPKCFGAQVWYSSNDKSKVLAEHIQNSLKEKIDDNNKRIPKAAKEQYRILRDGYDGACVLVECGFLSNYEEEQKLKSDEHQDKIVDSIIFGVDRYFNNASN
ncbi:N-acetylmuramoyl-L-alanine amidase AmiC precursor [Clostridium saccharobutylicum]|uniref:N-acetylmuramoyl-L-alanine amidase CwlD n=1 Tax=Clostridium saccharobutylicum TaxID=169679 RepID=UPI0009839362|nr:N-acetylmuramoyl-L-alanine amidase CwlD [Clostridium saccharobutylicum]AQS08185.1 N-acetylmuramoyl-L-alanine amidase AmiC precursor [Clostridium saccharobutylicum]MBC2435927.1 N-acetylmuramoyl-L-alanine amidase CwlD [Clostridium saccharobutylicum]NSB89007.1 N-acetylmuramoyl-L-alanine amidase [Clostridium saccharobutylicum]NYC29493.1 N-acetylmuramoyl-L-alanine amidase [Clostridium saccharobutylicum]OOM11499.1 N-acetylmuramoyl-L-alanine amidase AmiC precursor [Clostridium saccharobutylicum]